jgi:hypothetical protein
MRVAATLVATLLAAAIQAAYAEEFPKYQVAMAESGLRNVPNFRFDRKHTAGGGWQITDSNWVVYCHRAGVCHRPNALSATEWEQGQVAGYMWAEQGCLPWGPYNAQLRAEFQVCASPGKIARPSPASPSPRDEGQAVVATIAPAKEKRTTAPDRIEQFRARLAASSDVYSAPPIAFR